MSLRGEGLIPQCTLLNININNINVNNNIHFEAITIKFYLACGERKLLKRVKSSKYFDNDCMFKHKIIKSGAEAF